MPTPRNPTVHVPVVADTEHVFHTTTRCPRIPLATEPMTRSAARRGGLVECPRCFETRMQRLERDQPRVTASMERSTTTSTSGFSHFVVE
ncbi:hypothetical protein C2R22_04745 [Salinigranum rubrum]|uniref:Uncharacterized protein n=1 Tax=Salinigranum rubrum TaxID=755307 RepID=A0A2I8VGP1_9EURY|nr:hypothetical protein [Salinigranum rubrum]AUV81054.1 hypothetical protein C2R22_04745 [Salinigranum rubrum]